MAEDIQQPVSRARAVPRNIDRPNRMVEYIFVFLVIYYSLMFLTAAPLSSFFCGVAAVFILQKITTEKPEGQVYRLLYRLPFVKYGKMLPGPAQSKKFEI